MSFSQKEKFVFKTGSAIPMLAESSPSTVRLSTRIAFVDGMSFPGSNTHFARLLTIEPGENGRWQLSVDRVGAELFISN